VLGLLQDGHVTLTQQQQQQQQQQRQQQQQQQQRRQQQQQQRKQQCGMSWLIKPLASAQVLSGLSYYRGM
jgi:CHAT domain-containing protein